MKCKRCNSELLLESEREVALCLICQKILSRPPLIETAFERTNNEPTYLLDDLYCAEKPSDLSPPPCPSPASPTASPPLPKTTTPPKGGAVGLFFSFIAAIAMTVLAVIHLQPHLAGLDSLDLLVIFACAVVWRTVFKEVERNVKAIDR